MCACLSVNSASLSVCPSFCLPTCLCLSALPVSLYVSVFCPFVRVCLSLHQSVFMSLSFCLLVSQSYLSQPVSLFVCLCVYVSLSACISVCVCVCNCLSVCLPVSLYVCVCVCVCLFVYVFLSVCRCFSVSVYLSVCVFVCLTLSMPTISSTKKLKQPSPNVAILEIGSSKHRNKNFQN
jgi:hypothetical protein